jgi:MoxR-like ATPase
MQQNNQSFSADIQRIMGQLRQVVVGKDHILMWTMATILAGGHILLEDIPGVGKTTMALAFSKALGLQHNRVQFNPDVLPSDITGYSVPDTAGNMTYRPGAILCNLFLADELNRATSRTQSALLEAMEEGQVTVDGVAHKLPQPFIVIATQNPTGAAGTQLLPDSQMDRFTMRTSLGYPKPEDEKAMVLQRQGKNPMETLQALLRPEQLVQLQEVVANTYMDEQLVDYIVRLIDATRHHPQILRGASPRATLSVVAVSKAIAQLRGRDYVVPKDVQDVFMRIISHRLLLANSVQNHEPDCRQILTEIVSRVEALPV